MGRRCDISRQYILYGSLYFRSIGMFHLAFGIRVHKSAATLRAHKLWSFAFPNILYCCLIVIPPFVGFFWRFCKVSSRSPSPLYHVKIGKSGFSSSSFDIIPRNFTDRFLLRFGCFCWNSPFPLGCAPSFPHLSMRRILDISQPPFLLLGDGGAIARFCF